MMLLFFYIVMFSIQIIVCRSIAGYFCSDLFIFNGPDFTERTPFLILLFPQIKTYTREAREFSRPFPPVSALPVPRARIVSPISAA
jgi:hypothetical protein